VGISRQRNSDYKAEQPEHCGRNCVCFPPPFPSLAFIHASLACSDQAASKRAGEVHYENRSHTTTTLHTHHQASLMVTCYTTLVSPLRLCIGSSSSPALVVPPTRRSSLGDRAFLVTAARTWNSLTSTVTAASTLHSFHRARKLIYSPHLSHHLSDIICILS